MKQFKDLGIETESKGFVGDKIKVQKILNKKITVTAWEIKPSKYTGDCLYLQIELDGEKRLVMTGSKPLIEAIRKIPANCNEFQTTIIEDNERFYFT